MSLYLTTAEDAANYTIDNGFTVDSVKLDAPSTMVKLAVSEMSKNITYTLSVEWEGPGITSRQSVQTWYSAGRLNEPVNVSRTMPQRAGIMHDTAPLDVVQNGSGNICVNVQTGSIHQVVLFSLRGEAVVRYSGNGIARYRLPCGLPKGAYVVQLFVEGKRGPRMRVVNY